MPELAAEVESNRSGAPPAFAGAQASEAIITDVNPMRARVERLGGEVSDCVAGVPVSVGDRVLVVMSNEDRPWVICKLLDGEVV